MSEFGFAEEFLPAYDVSDAVAATVEADRQTAWRALLDVDLLKVGREAPLVGMLGALRMLPEIVGHLLHGERPAKPPESMRVRDLPSIPMYEGGWILLGERTGEEIALGLVGKFWRPTIEFASIGTAEEFRSFAEPGFAKTVYDLAVDELDPDTTLLSGLMRTATTDEHARRWFRRYWTFGVGSGAHILVGALIDSARRAARGRGRAGRVAGRRGRRLCQDAPGPSAGGSAPVWADARRVDGAPGFGCGEHCCGGARRRLAPTAVDAAAHGQRRNGSVHVRAQALAPAPLAVNRAARPRPRRLLQLRGAREIPDFGRARMLLGITQRTEASRR